MWGEIWTTKFWHFFTKIWSCWKKGTPFSDGIKWFLKIFLKMGFYVCGFDALLFLFWLETCESEQDMILLEGLGEGILESEMAARG